MANLAEMLKDLRESRAHAARELGRLDKAIAAVSRLVSVDAATPRKGRKRGRRRLSAAARKRIADAQRARWAKVRAKKQKAA